MNFPRQLKVLGRIFRITYLDRIDGEMHALGRTAPFEQRIEIAALSHENEQQILTTLIHEAVHAALHVSGHSVAMSPVGEESLVTMLTHFIEELIPQLAKIKQQDKT